LDDEASPYARSKIRLHRPCALVANPSTTNRTSIPMRLLSLLSLLLVFSPVTGALAAKPKVDIRKVERQQQGKLTALKFIVKASDSDGILRLEYWAAVDGKESGWVKFPYSEMPGYDNELPFTVDCDIFIFKVRSVDKDGQKSRVETRAFRNL